MATIGDIVLVYHEEHPAFFARIEDISPDPKPHWYHVKLLVLQMPIVEIVWILKDAYIQGEPFTMNEKSMRLELVQAPGTQTSDGSASLDNEPKKKQRPASGKVVSLFDRKKE